MKPLSLRLRLLVLFWGLLLLVFIPLYVFLAKTVKTDQLNYGQERAVHLLGAACWLFSSQVAFADQAHMQSWITDFGALLGTRLTYVEGGRVLADSHVHEQRLGQMEDHGDRPEIMAALAGQTGLDIRRSATIGRDLIYAARSCPLENNPQGVFRLSLPLSELYERLDALKSRFLAIFAACLLVSAFLSFLVARGFVSSITRLVALVSDVGKGAYHRRIYVEQGSEFEPLARAVNAMAADISSRIDAMNEQKAQLEALFNGLSEGVLTIDQNGRVLSANPAFKRFFPAVARMEGKTVIEAAMEPDLAAAVQRILQHQSDQEESLLLHRPGGRDLEARINIYRDPAGGLRCVVVIQDVSLPRRMEKIRRDFVANVSHELRTPLTSIKGYTETLLGDPPPEPETARAFLQVIHKNAEHMANMVTDLLKLARLESDTPLGTPKAVDAALIMKTALDTCSPMIEAKSLQVERMLFQEKILVLADQRQIVQVFQNIIENAVRFSHKRGKITIAAHMQGEFVAFSIADQGPGIPREQQDRLFERFYRQDSARTEGNGAGLGLAICKHIIRNHGGRIWVESVPGEGAAFSFTLKAVAAEQTS